MRGQEITGASFLGEITLLPSKDIADYKTNNEAIKMNLSRYEWQKKEYDEAPDNSYPKRKKNRNWDDKNLQFGSHDDARTSFLVIDITKS